MRKVHLRINFNYDAGIGQRLEEFEDEMDNLVDKILEIVGKEAEIDWRDDSELEVHGVPIATDIIGASESEITQRLFQIKGVKEVSNITDIR